MSIPLYRMIGMDVMKHALNDNLVILSHSFLNYISRSTSFYISIKHKEDYIINVYDDIVNKHDEIKK